MCASDPELLMVRATESHVRQVCNLLPEPETVEVVTDIFRGVEKCISTPIPFIATLAVAINACRNRYSGVLGDGIVCVPFTSCGIDGMRYRTYLMVILHETFLTARMSELAMDSLRETLHTYGLDICFLCCCGIALGSREKIDAFRGSEEHRAWDQVRSWYNAEPTPITQISSLKELEGVQTLDLAASGAEQKLFEEIDQMLYHLTLTPEKTPDFAAMVDNEDRARFLMKRAQAA